MFKSGLVIITTLALSGLGLIATRTSGPGSENPYQAFRRLQNEAPKFCLPSEQQAGAHEVAEKVYKTYRGLTHLSFTEQTNFYWCQSESRSAQRPLDRWSAKRWITTAKLQCWPERQEVEISVPTPNGEKQTFYYYLESGKPPSANQAGLNNEAVCALGIHRRFWIGPEMYEPEALRKMLEAGSWLGKTEYDGGQCTARLAPAVVPTVSMEIHHQRPHLPVAMAVVAPWR